MSQFGADFAASAVGDLLAYHGEEISYFIDKTQSSVTIKAIINAEGFSSRGSNTQLYGFAAILEISADDVPIVTLNADKVDLPGKYVGSQDATETGLFVSKLFPELSDGSMHVIGIEMGRRT